MINLKKYIFILLALAGLSACSTEELMDNQPESGNSNPFEVTVSVAIPDMPTSQTRGILGETPGANLKLTILEFEKGADAANTNLTKIYQAETTSPTDVANDGTVKFKVTLNSTSSAKVLHLMIADEFITCSFGSEANLIPMITTGIVNNISHEAYWGRVECDNGYVTIDESGEAKLSTDVKQKLTNVPVIRNFCKITVQNTAMTNFDFLGFELVNIPTAGTIAPWDQANLDIPELLSGADMLTYSQVSPVYKGIVPENSGFRNQETEIRALSGSEASRFSNAAQYIYEHPYESGRHTYMIIKGRYRAGTGSAWGAPSYYKIDLGKADSETGMFAFYPLLRNYNFNVVITDVRAGGASTPSQAIDGVAFNNISADTKTNAMLNVSDGKNMLVVSATSNIFVKEDQPFTLKYQYYTDVTGAKQIDNSLVQIKGIGTGEVIKSYTENIDGDWKTVTIYPNGPTAVSKTQSFLVTDGQGLGRVITLVLNLPWNITNMVTLPGIANEPSQTTSLPVSTDAGKELTVYFNLPDGIPEAVFPLSFKLEADKQDIENNPIGTLVVSTGASLFDPAKPAISYIKTVSLEEYKYMYAEGTGNNVDISKKNTNHLVRCRFRTITKGTGETKVKIDNPYFNPCELTFNRTN